MTKSKGKKPIYKKWWLWAVISIIAFGIIGCSGNGADVYVVSNATEAPVTEAPVTEAPATEAPVTEAPVTEDSTTKVTYILNINPSSLKFHKPNCSSVKQMKEKNKKEFYGTRDEAIDLGYSPCGNCKP